MKRLALFASLALVAAVIGPAAEGFRPRVIVSTDAGGTDFDDFQSLVHLFVYADRLELEGLVSSPMGSSGRKEAILRVIDLYAKDYPNLRTWSAAYPAPDALLSITKQGEIETAPYAGVRRTTEGSDWIVQCARRDDPRPLHVLLWGGIEDLAQALHDAPDILPKLRVYYIGGPNKKWSPDAYTYLATHYPKLWIIESNSTYYGWFVGGNQSGEWGNTEFVTRHVLGRGALGDYFSHGISLNDQTRSTVKMGDSPSVAWLLHGDPDRPDQPSWGGQYVRAWTRPYARFDRLTTAADRIERCGIFELVLPLGAGAPAKPTARLLVENQSLTGYIDDTGHVRFRFCPKEAKTYRYSLQSNAPALDGAKGELTSIQPSPAAARAPDPRLPNWWTDNPDPALAEGPQQGARTVSRWREEFLRDFAERLQHCQSPQP